VIILEVIDYERKMAEIKDKKMYYPYFLVYYGVKDESVEDCMYMDGNLSQHLYEHNEASAAQTHIVDSGNLSFENCFAGQIVPNKERYYTSSDGKIRVITECDLDQLKHLMPIKRKPFSVRRTTEIFKSAYESYYPIDTSDILLKGLDFTYIIQNTSKNNKNLYVSRGYGQGNSFPLWFGRDEDGNFYFSNNVELIDLYCEETNEFPTGCFAIVVNNEIHYFDLKTMVPLEFTHEYYEGKRHFQKQFKKPIWQRDEECLLVKLEDSTIYKCNHNIKGKNGIIINGILY
jgi:hypothetical protein